MCAFLNVIIAVLEDVQEYFCSSSDILQLVMH